MNKISPNQVKNIKNKLIFEIIRPTPIAEFNGECILYTKNQSYIIDCKYKEIENIQSELIYTKNNITSGYLDDPIKINSNWWVINCGLSILLVNNVLNKKINNFIKLHKKDPYYAMKNWKLLLLN